MAPPPAAPALPSSAPSSSDITAYYARLGASLPAPTEPSTHDLNGAWYQRLAEEYETQNATASMLRVAGVSFVVTFVLMMVLYNTCCVALRKSRRTRTMLNERCRRMTDVEKMHEET